ncbi:MAG: 3-hydroxyisobutyrate dehydrogenase [Gammaproteobacteria bacterium]|nr:3-hydroxyisobutyrate dehydrogenase [Gammaproteobacteria bacterium]
MANIGFIGLGHMGTPMVENLLQHKHTVRVFDLSEEAMAKAAALGALPMGSIKELVSNSTIIFTMLQTGEQVEQVALGEEGILTILSKEGLYIDSSSIDVVTSRKIHALAKQKKIAMIDAPVSGGVAGAKAATLTFMVGGEEENFLRAQSYLNCLGKKIIYAGPAGNGQAAKICNNMILGISMIAVSEGFLLAKKLGLDPKKFFDIASNASSQCWSMSQYCPMPGVLDNVPSSNEFTPGFTASMMLKDLKLSQEAAQYADASTPLGAEATALYSLFVEEGGASTDFSGIIKMLAGGEV